MNIVTRLLTGAVIGASVYGYASGAPNYGLPDGALDALIGYSAPVHCADLSPPTLNRVLANSPLVKLTGIKVLEVTGTRDAGTTKASLQCDVDVLTSTGVDMTVHASTKTVNGTAYILVSLF